MTCSIKERVKIWKEAFEEDKNAVLPTLYDFATAYAIYILAGRIVELASTDEDGKKQVNFLLLNFIAESFWYRAILTIRRLLDNESLDGKRGVNSLRSILKDIRKCQPQLTRRAYLEDISGLAYDIEEVERKHDEFLIENARNGEAIWTPPQFHSRPIRLRHEEFDFLSGTDPSNRNSNDLIKLEIIDRLEARLSRLDIIVNHANKYIAHAATKTSRRNENTAEIYEWGSEEIKEAIRILAETAALVGKWFIYRGVGNILPVFQYNQFQYLDKAMVSPDNLEILHNNWNDLDREMEQWVFKATLEP